MIAMIDAFLFLRPWWLLALIPLLAGYWWQHLRAREAPGNGGWANVIDPQLQPAVLIDAQATHSRRLPLAAASAALAIIGLAGPALTGKATTAMRSDVAQVLVVDLSPAMDADDIAPSRIELARFKLLDWLKTSHAGGETALIVYAAEPYLVTPLTTDTATIALFVPELKPDAMPLAGNAPLPALQMAANLLAGSPASEREILWVTAGADSRETVTAIAELRARKIDLALLHAAPSDDEKLRAEIVANHGRYARLSANDSDLHTLANGNESSPPTRQASSGTTSSPRDLGPWLLVPLVLLAAVAMRNALPVIVLSLSLLINPGDATASETSSWWSSPDQIALKRFKAGDFEAATKEFATPRWRAAALYRAGRHDEAATALENLTGADDLYNRGNALMHLQRFSEALAAYDAALALRPDDDDFRHNRDLAAALNTPPPETEGQGGGNNGSSSTGGRNPPPPARASASHREAAMLAEQWLRKVPDEPASLLKRKLAQEHQRRQAGKGVQR